MRNSDARNELKTALHDKHDLETDGKPRSAAPRKLEGKEVLALGIAMGGLLILC